MSTSPRIGFPLVVATIALLAAGCSSTVFDLETGNCLNFPDDTDINQGFELSTVDIVECTESHQAEVVGTLRVSDNDFPDVEKDAFPGQAALEEKANDTCLTSFNSYVGTDYDSSELDLFPLTPTEESWNKADDRTIVCVAVNMNNEVSESFKDSGL
ncbi:MAG: septum formation family protein [Actinomycetaceae bacterium]|nr:septum formation family protein [Actinomycetaceae bacterium]